jgi:hypothetical protein
MTNIPLDVACQLGDCRNRAALTVTVELPTSWTESREYTTRTLLVAVCGECAREVELLGLALLAARVQFATRLDRVQGKAKLLAQLVGLIEAVGPPFEPVQGGVFARWLAALDQAAAQGAWRLLAHVKRTREASRPPDPPPTSTRRARPSEQAPRIEDAGIRRPVLVRPHPAPGGGDDAA